METVRLTTGGLAQRFNWALPDAPLALPALAAAFSAPLYKDGIHTTYMAHVLGTGAVTATVVIEATDEPHSAGADDVELGTRNSFAIATTNTSTAITSKEPLFRSGMTGDEVYAQGVTPGTTMTYVSPTSATLSAAATATGTVNARFQARNWVLLATITLSGTGFACDGFATMAAWKWVRARVTAITGTNAAVYCRQGV